MPVSTENERTARAANQPIILFVVVYVSGKRKSVVPSSHLPHVSMRQCAMGLGRAAWACDPYLL